jgi:hypothetical protein
MSRWTEVDGTLAGVTADLSHEETPQGSEGGSPLSRYYQKGHWMWHANLRDRGEEDAPEIRDWFADLCKRTSPTKAALEIDNGYSRYSFEWNVNDRVLRLDVPPLYREEAPNVLKWLAHRRDSLPPQYRDALAPWVTLDG